MFKSKIKRWANTEREVIDVIISELTHKKKEMLMNAQAMTYQEIKNALIKFE